MNSAHSFTEGAEVPKTYPPLRKKNHTPGPWRVALDFVHTAPDYHQIVALDGPHYKDMGFSFTAVIDIHDAKLIAAAPDLLSALIDARELMKNWGIDEEAAGHALLHKIEEAIKKATS